MTDTLEVAIFTPGKMREKSAKHLHDAREKLRARDFDMAAYEAGFAAELALKARYCSRCGLSSLPTDKKLLRHHKLDTHDLEKLLRLSGSAFIDRSSMNDIDWATVSDWSNEDRYDALGKISEQVAINRVGQTQALFDELVEHEVVEALARERDQMVEEGVDLGLLALVRAHDSSSAWRLLISSFALDKSSTRERVAREIGNRFFQVVPADCRPRFSGSLDYFGRGDPVPLAYYNLVDAVGGMGPVFVTSSIVMGGGSVPPPHDFSGVLMARGVLVDGQMIERAYVLRSFPPTA